MSSEEQWSDYWRTDGQNNTEVFVDKDGRKHPELSDFWQKEFENYHSNDSVIDIASGAGSVLSNLQSNHNFRIYAQDISDIALKYQKNSVENLEIIVSSADDIPVDSTSFDRVVSQFGIEYAGKKAFVEASRILTIGGTITFLCHYRNGYIDNRNKIELKGIELINKNNFINKATKLTNLMFGSLTKEGNTIVNEFTKVEPILEGYAAEHSHGIHTHMYSGFRKLISNHTKYIEQDILDWLSEMKNDISKSKLRLTEMRKAALSKKQVIEIVDMLKSSGLKEVNFKPMTLKGGQLPLAWCIRGKK